MGEKALELEPRPAQSVTVPRSATVTTYLDFGMTKGGKRTSYDYREGQHAYDLFMGARYLNDLIAYRNGEPERVYHPEDLRDNVRKYTALSVCRRGDAPLTYYEIGSSVCGVIDAVNYLNGEYRELDPRRITWFGVDNSTFMNAMAQYTHEGYDLHVSDVVAPVACDLFFAKGVSLLYALDTELAFCDVLGESRVAIFDYTFSRRGRISDVVGTGLPVTFLSLEECQRGLERPGKRLILAPYSLRTYHQSADKVTYDCIYGDEDLVERYLTEMDRKASEFERIWRRPLVRPVK